jgi:hypothetical protein
MAPILCAYLMTMALVMVTDAPPLSLMVRVIVKVPPLV